MAGIAGIVSGWRRLWLVLSVLLGIPAALLAYSESKTVIGYTDYPKGMTGEQFWQNAKREPALKDCVWHTAEATRSFGASYMITCRNRHAYDWAIIWALIPAGVLAVVGLTVRWIYRGFRDS